MIIVVSVVEMFRFYFDIFPSNKHGCFDFRFAIWLRNVRVHHSSPWFVYPKENTALETQKCWSSFGWVQFSFLIQMMDIVLLIKNVFRLLMTHRNDDKKIPFDIENFIGLLSKKFQLNLQVSKWKKWKKFKICLWNNNRSPTSHILIRMTIWDGKTRNK